MKNSDALQQAIDLLGQSQLPDDTEARLEELEHQVRDDEKDKFGDLWEAFIVMTGPATPPPIPE